MTLLNVTRMVSSNLHSSALNPSRDRCLHTSQPGIGVSAVQLLQRVQRDQSHPGKLQSFNSFEFHIKNHQILISDLFKIVIPHLCNPFLQGPAQLWAVLRCRQVGHEACNLAVLGSSTRRDGEDHHLLR